MPPSIASGARCLPAVQHRAVRGIRLWHRALLLAAAVAPLAAKAHGGGLNAEGCHNDRKTGGYHCHRAPTVAPRPAPSNAAGLVAQPASPGPVRPTCYTGPRGGTYTITPSGRKNYGGC